MATTKRIGDKINGSSVLATAAPAPRHTSPAFQSKPAPRNPTNQQIAEAAYFLWQRRGGDQMKNWLDAEATLRRTITGGR